MRSLAAAHLKRSKVRKNDPTGSNRIIREYEINLRTLFRNFGRAAGDILQNSHHLAVIDALDSYSRHELKGATELPKPAIDLPTVTRSLDDAAKREILDPGKALTETGALKAFQQGTLFAVQTLTRAGLGGAWYGATRGGPADWRTLDWLKVRNLEVLKGITQEMNKKIVLELGEGIDQGEGIPDLAKRLQVGVNFGENRAKMMASYETMYAVNHATALRYAQAGFTEEDEEWLSAIDEKTCDICRENHGKSIAKIGYRPPIHPHDRCTTLISKTAILRRH